MSDPDEPVPRLSRGAGFKLRTPDLVRIGMFATLLVCVIALGRPCADGMAGFVESFSPPPDAAPAAPALQLERLTEEEIRRRFPGEPDAGPEATQPTTPTPASPASK